MSDSRRPNSSIKSSWAMRRKEITTRPVRLSQHSIVKASELNSGELMPLVIQPAEDNLSLNAWAANNRDYIETNLLEHGAILFRGFDVRTVEEFEGFATAVSGELMEYRERSSPRSRVGVNIYTSTDYPPDQKIFPHNEHSYSITYPLRLYFFCLLPAPVQGETPLVDTRKVYNRISPKTRERFIEKKWMYVRNFGDGFGLSWQTVFQTEDKNIVEEYCRRTGILWEWKEGGRLRTRQVRDALVAHPRTGESLWFNHITFFHVSTLEPTVRDALLKEFEEEDLPNNTYYGDGTSIESWVLDELREAYSKDMVVYPWQQGDIVLLDNMLVAHARNPYSGPRKILFAMAELVTRQDN